MSNIHDIYLFCGHIPDLSFSDKIEIIPLITRPWHNFDRNTWHIFEQNKILMARIKWHNFDRNAWHNMNRNGWHKFDRFIYGIYNKQ